MFSFSPKFYIFPNFVKYFKLNCSWVFIKSLRHFFGGKDSLILFHTITQQETEQKIGKKMKREFTLWSSITWIWWVRRLCQKKCILVILKDWVQKQTNSWCHIYFGIRLTLVMTFGESYFYPFRYYLREWGWEGWSDKEHFFGNFFL